MMLDASKRGKRIIDMRRLGQIEKNGEPSSVSRFVASQSVWFGGIDQAMASSGGVEQLDAAALVAMQNSAIRESWQRVGDLIRAAMLDLSESTGVYPQELKEDKKCRTKLATKNSKL